MAQALLTTAASLQCPHGGSVVLTSSAGPVMAGGAPVVLLSDLAMVAGCPFTVGPAYQPCLTVRWMNGATQVAVNGTPVLLQGVTGLCLNGLQVPQGNVIVVSTQTQAQGT